MTYYVNGGSVIAVGIIFPVLGAIVVIGRFYARSRRNTTFKTDDWLSLPALVLTVALGAIMIYGSTQKTIGYHSPQQSIKQSLNSNVNRQVILNKLEFSFFLISYVALCCIKLSILFFYRRIFRGLIFDIVCWILMTIVVLWTVAFFISDTTQCGSHITALWSPSGNIEAICDNTFEEAVSMGISDFIIDILILVFPLPFIWNLNMRAAQKVAISGIFLLGIFTVAASCMKMVLLIDIMNYKYGSNETIFGLSGTTDPIGVVSVGLFWSYIEVGVAMIASCLPSLSPIFGSIAPSSAVDSLRRLISSRSSSSGQRSEQLSNSVPGTLPMSSESKDMALRFFKAEGKQYGLGGDAENGAIRDFRIY